MICKMNKLLLVLVFPCITFVSAATTRKRWFIPLHFPLKECHSRDIDLAIMVEPPVTSQGHFMTIFVDTILNIFLAPDEKNLTRVRVAVVASSSKNVEFPIHFDQFTLKDDLIAHLNVSKSWHSPNDALRFTLEANLDLIRKIFLSKTKRREQAHHIAVMGIVSNTESTLKEVKQIQNDMEQNRYMKLFTVIFDQKNTQKENVFADSSDTLVFSSARSSVQTDKRIPLALCGICHGDLHFSFAGQVEEVSCHWSVTANKKHVSWNTASHLCGNTQEGALLSSFETREEITAFKDFVTEQFKQANLEQKGSSIIEVTDSPYRIFASCDIGLTRNKDVRPRQFHWVNDRPLIHQYWNHDFQSKYVNFFYHIYNCAHWIFDGYFYYGNYTIENTWLDIPCAARSATRNHFRICELTLTRYTENIIREPASKESIENLLNKGTFVFYQGVVVSLSALNMDFKSRNQLIAKDRSSVLFICNPDDDNPDLVSYIVVCDHIKQCSNGRDEEICEYRTCDTKSEFRCRSGQCVPLAARCDVFTDCTDASDETDCDSDECKGHSCGDGPCIPKHWVHDGEKDCRDWSRLGDDEYQAPDFDGYWKLSLCAFICNRSQCVSPAMFRDNVTDCTGPEGTLDVTIGALQAANINNTYNVTQWSPLCVYLKDRYGEILGSRDMSHLHSCENFTCPEGYSKCPGSYCIPLHYVLNGVTDCQFGEDEEGPVEGNCTGNFQCWRSEMCLHPHLVCDGYPHCPSRDDEIDCFVSCAPGLTCTIGIVVVKDNDKQLKLQDLSFIDLRTRYIDLSGVDLSYSFPSASSRGRLLNVIEINLSGCKIRDASGLFLKDVHLLNTVYHANVSFNDITKITKENMFRYMKNVRYLDLSNNRKLCTIEEGSLCSNKIISKMEALDLSFTGLSVLEQGFLQCLRNLKILNLSYTLINRLNDNSFPEAFVLHKLDLHKTPIQEFTKDTFNGMTIKVGLYTDKFGLCCPQVRKENIPAYRCQAPGNSISSCTHLVGKEIHRVLLWFVGSFAITGNIVVIIFRICYDRAAFKKPYVVFITNLGVSDFIMGIYLVIIAAADEYYKNEYVIYDTEWRNSRICELAGVMSMFSSETSTFFIFLVTLDRYLIIKYPFGRHWISFKQGWIITAIAWLFGFTIALVPSLVDTWTIFSSNAMCLNLPLTSERLGGWAYSTAIFVMLNFILFLSIAYGQWSIYSAMADSNHSVTSTEQRSIRRSQDIEVAKQLSLIVLSDFLCWFPIGLMGLVVLSGTEISHEAYAWSAVLVLPVNSALNPVLYTFPIIMKRWKDFKSGRSLSSNMMRSTVDLQSSIQMRGIITECQE